MMEERYHATTQNWFYPDMSNVNKNITVEANLISPSTYIRCRSLKMAIDGRNMQEERSCVSYIFMC